MNIHLRIILAVSISLGCGFVQYGYAQEGQDFLRDLDSVRDPFQSQLPPPKEVPVVQHVAQNINPPVNVAPPVRPVTVPVKLAPVPVKPPEIKTMVVKGLVWNTDEPQAIVNGEVVGVGDEVDGVEIISIDQKGVEFSNKGLKFFVDVSGHRNTTDKKL